MGSADFTRRTSQAARPMSQLTWKGLVYPNHQLVSDNGIFGINGADTLNGAPYGAYVIVSGEPYIPMSLIWHALGQRYRHPTTLIDCINDCEVMWFRMLNGYNEPIDGAGGYARTLCDVDRAYTEWKASQ